MLALSVLAGCKDLSSPLASGTVDPSTYTTPESAIEITKSARLQFMNTAFNAIIYAGLMTDELQSYFLGSSHINDSDTRTFTATSALYLELHKVRQHARLGRGAMRKYAPQQPSTLLAEMLVLEAISDMYLADFYCSGIPLSTVDFEGDFTYKSGSATYQVYQEAVRLLDSAHQLSKDSARYQSLIRVIKARSLLALGQYSAADTLVATVPDGFVFDYPLWIFGNVSESDSVSSWGQYGSAANREGGNGLSFREPRDPRIPWKEAGYNAWGVEMFLAPMPHRLYVAGSVEARLIQAEAAAQQPGDRWLQILNGLRTDGTYVVSGTDTSWRAGSGRVDGLAPLTDPTHGMPEGQIAKDLRIDLVFRERAFWLYLTGRRQGDLRRLVREYGRKIEVTYPFGEYFEGQGVYYSTTIDMPILDRTNPLYTGCLSREGN